MRPRPATWRSDIEKGRELLAGLFAVEQHHYRMVKRFEANSASMAAQNMLAVRAQSPGNWTRKFQLGNWSVETFPLFF
jgi:hypothetical protein